MNPTSDDRILIPQGPVTDIRVDSVPSIPRLLATLFSLSLVRNSSLAEEVVLDNVRLTYEGWTLDPDKVRQFKAVCGYPGDHPHPVPAPYIQTLFIGIISRFISSGHFPINPMGLIQVGQSFTRHRPVALSEPVDLTCSLLDMTQTPRGITTRFDMQALCRGTLAWQGVATYFTRAKNPPPREKAARQEETLLPIREVIRVPADTGRRYAAVSRDYNPHHLYPWTARLIGFNRAIAHGIWSLARSCASLEAALGCPDALTVDAGLKLPIFLPAAVTLGWEARDREVAFELREETGQRPHLKGRFAF